MKHRQNQLKTITKHRSPPVPKNPSSQLQPNKEALRFNSPQHHTYTPPLPQTPHRQKGFVAPVQKLPLHYTHKKKQLVSKRSLQDETTELSSAQHMSLVMGDYQLQNTDRFRRKNVKFVEKSNENSGARQPSSRQSSILKNSSRLLNNSLVSSDRSISIQDSFTATRKSRLVSMVSDKTSNLVVEQRYKAILEAVEGSRQGYTDDLFPPVDASVFTGAAKRNPIKKKEEIVWRRASELYGNKKLKVLPSAQGKNYRIQLGQKSLASPYLATSFNALKDKIQLLQVIFGHETLVNKSGAYLVKIYQENAWKNVIVDDWIPCLRMKAGKESKKDKVCSAFIDVNTHEKEVYLWPLLLQKAYASYYRCYQNLKVGNVVDMMAELTGVPPCLIDFKDQSINVEKVIDRVSKDLMSETCIVLGQNQKGIYPIAFTVSEDYITQEKVITFTDEKKHQYKFDSDQLPTMFRRVISYRSNRYTQSISCSVFPPKKIKKPTKPSPKIRLHQIPPNDCTSIRSFTVSKRTSCVLSLQQKDNRFYYQCGIDSYLWVRAILVEREYDGGMRWINGVYSNQKHLIFEEILDPGQYRLIMMVEWRQMHNREITVQLASDLAVGQFKRQPCEHGDKTIELACMDLAQRKGNFTQINKLICSYNLLHEPSGLIIENIVNENTKGPATIIRSINGLKAQTQIVPVNTEFEVQLGSEYGEKCQRAYGPDIELDLGEGQSYTVVLRMRAGVDKKFFKMFNFS